MHRHCQTSFQLVVEIRFSSLIDTDSHTSDIGHRFGMTGFRILQHAREDFGKREAGG